MSIERQTAAGLKWTGFAKLGSQLLSWAVTLIVLRILMPEDYGLMAIVTVVVAILTNVAELGLGSSLVQAPVLQRDDVTKVTGAVLLLSVAAFALTTLCAPLAAAVYGDDRLTALIRVASIQFLLNGLSTVPLSLAYREMRFRELAWIELASVVCGSLATLGFAWHGAAVWALVLGSLFQAFVRTALLVRTGPLRPAFTLEGIRRFVTFGGQMTASRLLWQVVYQSDVLIAGRFLTSGALGLYSVSIHLATLPMQKIMGIVNQVAFPAVARLQDDLPRLRMRILEASRLLTLFSVSAMWGMSAVAPELVRVVLGAKWEGAIFPLQVVCLVAPLRMINAIFTTSMLGIGRAGLELRNSAISAVVLPISFYAGAQWGTSGLAVAWLLAIPVIMLLNLPRMLRALDMRASDVAGGVWASAAAGATMYGVVAFTRALLVSASDLVRLPVLVVVGGATFVIVVLLLDRRVRPEIGRLVAAFRS